MATPSVNTALSAIVAMRQALGGAITTTAVTSVTIGATTTQILAASSTRRKVVITNISDEDVFVNVGGAAVQSDGLVAGAKIGSAYQAPLVIVGDEAALAINGICASGSKDVAVWSGSTS